MQEATLQFNEYMNWFETLTPEQQSIESLKVEATRKDLAYADHSAKQMEALSTQAAYIVQLETEQGERDLRSLFIEA